MKKIGQGLQFNVYLENNKIIKKPTSRLQMFLKLISWNPLLLFNPRKVRKEINQASNLRILATTKLSKINFNKEILANPIFHKDQIEQDKVTPLIKVINKDYNNSKILVEKYIKLIFECWKNGFADKIFNLAANNGVTNYGNLVLIDLGELTFEKSEVERDIKTKRWERAADFRFKLKKDIKLYYQKRMKEEMTISNLNKYWKFRK